MDGPFQGTPIQQHKVADAVAEWMRYINITFTRFEGQTATIRITMDPAQEWWSHVGLDATLIPFTESTMNLAWIDPSPTVLADEHAIILHEFGHVIGLVHERQSPVRGGKLTLNEAGMYTMATW